MSRVYKGRRIRLRRMNRLTAKQLPRGCLTQTGSLFYFLKEDNLNRITTERLVRAIEKNEFPPVVAEWVKMRSKFNVDAGFWDMKCEGLCALSELAVAETDLTPRGIQLMEAEKGLTEMAHELSALLEFDEVYGFGVVMGYDNSYDVYMMDDPLTALGIADGLKVRLELTIRGYLPVMEREAA